MINECKDPTFTYGFNNVITACDDGKRRDIDPDKIKHTMFHRINFAKDDGGGGHWPDIAPIANKDLTGPLVADRFKDSRRIDPAKRDYPRDRPGSYTGGQMPYGCIVCTNGKIDQCLAYGDYGPHAMRWSWCAFSIAAVGDFTQHAPTAEQVVACIQLGALLLAACDDKPLGHTEVPGSSSDSTKQCPGKFFDMRAMRQEIQLHPLAQLLPQDAKGLLTAAGFQWV